VKDLGSDLISKDESVRRVGKILAHDGKRVANKNILPTRDLFDYPQSFAFYFKHPHRKLCSIPGKCGFLIKTTPMPPKFPYLKIRAELCLDHSEYPKNLHIHTDDVTAEKIHLLALCESEYLPGFFTWNSEGAYIDKTGIFYSNQLNYGIDHTELHYNFKLVAFIGV
jgi:hypothetical protein